VYGYDAWQEPLADMATPTTI